MATSAPSHRDQPFAPPGPEGRTAAFLKVRAGRRAPPADREIFSPRLASTRSFVADPTD